jgi:hypothetical protein
MRLAFIVLIAAMVSGCAYLPRDVSRVEIKPRDGDAVYYGVVKRASPAVATVTVEIDRRVYTGNFERTFPNATFGHYVYYGLRDAASKTAEELSETIYAKAILSSSDLRVLTCDFTDTGTKGATGLCVNEAGRVYDVILS